MSNNTSVESISRRPSARPYRSPRLEALGDIRDITLSGSCNLTESGGAPYDKAQGVYCPKVPAEFVPPYQRLP